MKVISVRQPWAWAILYAGKDVENRTWPPSAQLLKAGDRLAIHASKTFDVDGLRWICEHHAELGLPLDFIPIDRSAYPVGCVIGSVEFVANIDVDLYQKTKIRQSPWFFGPVGWLVDDPRALEDPVPMKGRLGLFDVPDLFFKSKGPIMSKKKNEAVEEVEVAEEAEAAVVAERAGRFVDIRVEERMVAVRLPDERLLEIADEACSKRREVIDLHRQIKAFSDARKGLIKSLDEEAAELDEQFYNKTENVKKEVRVIMDFVRGTIRTETPDGEFISEENMPSSGYQREFSALMEGEPGAELIEKATQAVTNYLEQKRPEDEVVNVEMLESSLGGGFGIELSDSMAERVIVLLREKGVIRGRGYPGFPFVMVDPETEEEADKEQSEEIGEDQFLEAVTAINETQRASTSMLQRKLRIGYNRAARLMDLMETRGVIGPVVENEPREILLSTEECLTTEGTGCE